MLTGTLVLHCGSHMAICGTFGTVLWLPYGHMWHISTALWLPYGHMWHISTVLWLPYGHMWHISTALWLPYGHMWHISTALWLPYGHMWQRQQWLQSAACGLCKATCMRLSAGAAQVCNVRWILHMKGCGVEQLPSLQPKASSAVKAALSAMAHAPCTSSVQLGDEPQCSCAPPWA
jgi:hypothetical protein